MAEGLTPACQGLPVAGVSAPPDPMAKPKIQPGLAALGVHAGVGVQIFVTEHVFIKTEFDFHYVPGLTDQFGSNMVPGGMVWLGYSWGDR